MANYLKIGNGKVRYEGEFICLTDMAKLQPGDNNTAIMLHNWLQLKGTILFLGVIEEELNEDFNLMGFHEIKNRLVEPSFGISFKKFIESTNAKMVYSKPGRYGGTFAHEFIAIQFASWLSPKFHVRFLMSYKKLLAANQKSLRWALQKVADNINEASHLLDTIEIDNKKLLK